MYLIHCHDPSSKDQVKSRVNPYMGLITLKLFVDVVPSSSEDVTQAIRGQAKWLSRNQLRRNGGKGGEILFCLDFQKTFHSRDVSALLFVVLFGWAFVCIVLVWLVHSVLGSSVKKPQRKRKQLQWCCTCAS